MTQVQQPYAVRVFRDSDLWIIEVEDPDVAGQARTLAAAQQEARELIAVWLDVPVESVAVTMDYSAIDPEASRLVAQARATQATADDMIRDAALDRRQAARRLVRDGGLSLRDAAAVLGVSFARVQQLVTD